jgi:predicted lipoprotein with Yx(FWY)xxD motif
VAAASLRAVRAPLVLLVSVTVLVGGCGAQRDTGSSTTGVTPTGPSPTASSSPQPGTASPATTSAAPASSPRGSASAGTVVTTAASQFGPVLFDRTGQAIYIFDAETTSKPSCYGDCARAWPPVVSTGQPIAGGAVRQNLLGVTTRSGGLKQATYRGQPLYFYAHEGKHQVLCHNVTEFGGRWLAITAAADPAPT